MGKKRANSDSVAGSEHLAGKNETAVDVSTRGSEETFQCQHVVDTTDPDSSEVENNRQRLDKLETIIRQSLQTFIDVGRALLEVRDRKLYELRNYATFETYCRHHLEISRQRGYQLMDAAEVVKNLSTAVDTPVPTNEAQARELTDLKPEQQREVWNEALKTAPSGKLTAGHVRQTRTKLIPKDLEPVVRWKLVRRVERSFARLMEKLFAAVHSSQHGEIYEIITDVCARQLDVSGREAENE
jgi:hypothetical protein